uniref:Rap guanine nucleotide exchange factor (GEF)-like 1 n=1 Tax=Cyprinodon variegatus TaxID=28743 RepID=A0A3Q2D2N5_CYPVA
MPAGMKPLEKFLKKQTTALTRAGGFGGVGDKASGTGASRRRASLSRVVPFFRETSPESGHVREVFTLLDDFMLTHPIFLTADRLQQVLLQFTLEADGGGGERRDGEVQMSAAERKQAVLNMAFRYLDTYRELLQEEGERSNSFPKELYSCAVKELTRYPELVEDVLKLQRWTEILHCSDEEKESRKKQVRPLFRHFRRIDACLQPREAFRGSDEFCRVYTPDHSYVTIRSRLSCRVGEILALVKEKLQYSEDQPVLPGNLILVAVTSSGKAVFRPSDEAVFTTLGVNTHLFACEPSELDSLQLPLPEEIHWTPGDSKLHDMSAEEVANQLVVFDWELFSCVHEVEFICYVFHGEQSRWRPLNLELVLQRCSEVQHWVATEILQCQSLPKRIQLLRKFIKIAACKQQQDLLSFLAVVLGLDNPAVSRLRLTWEGLPGKFRKQFQQFESLALQDPSRNHKSYRDLMTSLRPPLIPFTPLLLKHKVAEMVRTIRRFRSSQLVDTETSPSHLQTKAYVRQLQVIDNQNLLFDMSCKLEPKDT